MTFGWRVDAEQAHLAPAHHQGIAVDHPSDPSEGRCHGRRC
jgi:hypothetical protein